MSERSFYVANKELTAALRAMADERTEWWTAVIAPYEAQYPNNPPVWNQFGGSSRCVGFADDDPDNPPPDGLSRAKTRTHLIPKRTKAGKVWSGLIDKFNEVPQPGKVFKDFGIDVVLRPGVLHSPNWMDLAMVDGPVVVYLGTEFHTVPDCLTLMPRSEFYALHERAMTLQEQEQSA